MIDEAPQPSNPEEHKETRGLITWLGLFLGGAGAILPGATYFLDHAPPLFTASAFLISFGALAILICAYNRRRAMNTRAWPGLALILASIVLFVGYETGLQFFSAVPEEREGEARYPIGFHMARWSLTEAAIKQLDDKDHPLQPINTPHQLMMATRGYQDGPWVVWRPNTIMMAGGLILAVYATSFGLWAWGWAILARTQIGTNPIRKMQSILRHGKEPRILYDSRDGREPTERVIQPHLLIETADKLLIHALQTQPQRLIRHFAADSIIRVEVADSAGVEKRTIDFHHVSVSIRSTRDGKRGMIEQPWFRQYANAVQEAIADLTVEEWEQHFVASVRAKLKLTDEQVRAVHAFVFAEFLIGCAEDGIVDPEESENIPKLASCLQALGWRPG